jgi:hypothetical protein
MSTKLDIRCALEVAVIRQTLAALQVAGFHPVAVDDGEEMVDARSADEVLTLALNLDDCYVHFGAGNWMRLVFGNDGWDVISDYSAGDCNPFADKIAEIEPEKIAIPAGCDTHTWAWQNRNGDHGGCIKCGRHSGAGALAKVQS